MSGPKIVRIVSPEEFARLESQRDKLLSEIRLAIKSWGNALRELGMFNDDKERDAIERLNVLEQSFFPNFSKSVQRGRDEIRFLQNDIDQARIEAKAKLRARGRNLEISAKSLEKELRKLGHTPSRELLTVIGQAKNASEAELDSFQKHINDALSAYIKAGPKSSTNGGTSDLVKLLAEGQPDVESIDVHLKSQRAELEKKNQRLDRLIAEIEIMADDEQSLKFIERANRIESESSGTQRELLIDSLILDLSAHCRREREHQKVLQLLFEVKDELSDKAFDSLTIARLKIDDAIKKPIATKDAELLATAIREQMQQEIVRQSAPRKRKAILDSFAQLGYDIKEGMETYWTENGRVVVSKLTSPSEGIELGAGEPFERLQMRAVAVGPKGLTINSEDGIKVETSWCSELEELKTSLTKAGHQFVIEQAHPIGKFPLKVCEPVSWIGNDDDCEDEHERPTQQKLQSKGF